MRGFSLIEILIVIAIFTVVASVGVSPLLRFKKANDLSAALETGVSLLLEARTKTLSSEGGSRYGVHFESARITLFSGDAFAEGAAGNKAAPIPSSVEIQDISLLGGG